MATADSEVRPATAVPDEIVVDFPYEDVLLDLLRDLGLRREVKASSTSHPALGHAGTAFAPPGYSSDPVTG